MANPDKRTALTEETIKNGQSRQTGNIDRKTIKNGQSRQTGNIDRRDNQEWPIQTNW